LIERQPLVTLPISIFNLTGPVCGPLANVIHEDRHGHWLMLNLRADLDNSMRLNTARRRLSLHFREVDELLPSSCGVADCVSPAHVYNQEDVAQYERCRKGHLLTPEFVKVTKQGERCRACMRRAQREYYARKKTAQKGAQPR
jgi:hypothetical protein